MIKLLIRSNFIADYFCTSPPLPPTPGGVTSFEDDDESATFSGESRVNYTCPDGYGLDGIPIAFALKIPIGSHILQFTIVTVRQFCDSFCASRPLA